ncbi:MAG: prenyltransferase [Candidatus Thermoplasmatota archaeon]|nr:prenyltransferase [Candidatus Thermoplasmatota archaeon]
MAGKTTEAREVTEGQLWIRALRAPFLVASVLPFLVGILAAYQAANVFDPLLFALSLVGVILFHLATNMLNDNFDYRSGNDLAVEHQNPFAGGSRVLITGRVNVKMHLAVALTIFVAGIADGLLIFFLLGGFGTPAGQLLFVIGVIGAVTVYSYVGPPLKLANRGLGEFFVGLAFGPLVVVGAYLVQTGTVTPGAVFLSLSMGLLVAAILWINEFPDVSADVSVGKKTLMARLGPERSVNVYIGLVVTAFLMPVLASILRLVPPTTALTLLAVPLAMRAARGLRANYQDPHALIPTNAGTVGLTVVFSILLLLGLGLGIWIRI